MEPPENERPRLAGRSFSGNFSDDARTVTDTQHACKKQFPDWPPEVESPKHLRGDRKTSGNDAPPDGYAFADVANNQVARLEPITLHPSLLPEPEPLTRERIALRAVLEWVRLCRGHEGKVTAFFYEIGEEKGEPDDIAKALNITERMFRNYRAEARTWFSGFIAAIESESVPSQGVAKP